MNRVSLEACKPKDMTHAKWSLSFNRLWFNRNCESTCFWLAGMLQWCLSIKLASNYVQKLSGHCIDHEFWQSKFWQSKVSRVISMTATTDDNKVDSLLRFEYIWITAITLHEHQTWQIPWSILVSKVNGIGSRSYITLMSPMYRSICFCTATWKVSSACSSCVDDIKLYLTVRIKMATVSNWNTNVTVRRSADK